MTLSNFWPDAKQTLLLHAVLDRCDQSARTAAMHWLDSVDFDAIDPGSFRLLPLLHGRMQTLEVAHPLAARIKGVFRRNWYFEQRIRHKLRSVRAVLHSGGVEGIFLKGVALGLDVYSHGAFRPADDIDLLLRREDIDRTVDLLIGAGWRVGTIGGMAGRHARIMHSDVCALDLHLSPFHERLTDAALHPVWAEKRCVMLDGAPALLLSTHHQLLHTLVHGLRVNEVPPIRWVADAALMIARYDADLDWSRFASQAATLAYTLVVGRALRYLAAEFEIEIPRIVLMRMLLRPKGLLERAEYRCEREGDGNAQTRLDDWLLQRRDARNFGFDEDEELAD